MRGFTLAEPCELRPIRFLELLEMDGWMIKVYGIAYKRDLPRPELVDEAKRLARKAFPLPAEEEGRYGVGYLGVHDGRGHNFVFADWWADENELHHRVFLSPDLEPGNFEEYTATGLSACVWDMRLMCFERQAWMDTVLRNSQGPDLEAYLTARLNEDA